MYWFTFTQVSVVIITSHALVQTDSLMWRHVFCTLLLHLLYPIVFVFSLIYSPSAVQAVSQSTTFGPFFYSRASCLSYVLSDLLCKSLLLFNTIHSSLSLIITIFFKQSLVLYCVCSVHASILYHVGYIYRKSNSCRRVYTAPAGGVSWEEFACEKCL